MDWVARARTLAMEAHAGQVDKAGHPYIGHVGRVAATVRGDDDFTQCIDPMEQVLVPTSKDGKLIDGLTVVVGPYSAGPYAEGSYEVALPVDAAMRDAIKPDYRDAFVAVN